MNIENRVALVTGSSSGIGQATAIEFAKKGAKVVVNYHQNKAGGEKTLVRVREQGVEGILVRANVAKERDLARLFGTVVDRFGTLDILVNNVGVPYDGSFLEMTQQDMRRVIDTNFTTVALGALYAIRFM